MWDLEDDCILVGWERIAKFFNVSERTMLRRRKELLSSGAIFYRYTGKPPRKRVCAFKSALIQWVTNKAKKGEMF